MTQDHDDDLSNFSMLDIFRMELDGQIATLNENLLMLEHERTSAEILEALMRAAHSIKGAARMVGVNGIVKISHFMEDCFVTFQASDGELTRKDIDLLLEGVDLIQKILQSDDDGIVTWELANADALADIERSLATIGKDDDTSEINTSHLDDGTDIESEPSTENLQSRTEKYSLENVTTIRIAVDRLDQILSLASKSLVETHQLNALMPSFWQVRHNQQLIISQLNSLQEQLTLNGGCIEMRQQLKEIITASNSIRYDYSECISKLDAIDRRASVISDHLHREVMASRMRPISDIVNVLPRVVRDIGRKLDKNVRLKMSGLSTLVDRNVLEKVDIPIKHIIQNAIDHGIEYPQERLRNGKDEVATISLNVNMSAGMLFIIIEDDGAGINYDTLKERILNKGLATSQELENLDNMGLIDFLFYPGFSTRTVVSDISGRGVGLDLVKDAVTSLNGSVYAVSETGKGTCFQLILPLTVSVIRTLLATINGESYAFPAAAVERIYYANSEDLNKKNTGYKINIDGEAIKLVNANAVFNSMLTRVLSEQIIILVITHADKKYGVIVEKVDGEHELSIHKLSEKIGKIQGISSAAILNSGSLTLIIDIEEYFQLIEKLIHENPFVKLSETEENGLCDIFRVLVVDDSLTVREAEKQVLLNMHYQVATAFNGEEALNILQAESFDLIVTDIDMPVMDGIRLVNEVRFQPEIKDIPIVIVSNRDKSFVDQGVVLDEKTVFYSKDHFEPESFATTVHQLAKMAVNVS